MAAQASGFRRIFITNTGPNPDVRVGQSIKFVNFFSSTKSGRSTAASLRNNTSTRQEHDALHGSKHDQTDTGSVGASSIGIDFAGTGIELYGECFPSSQSGNSSSQPPCQTTFTLDGQTHNQTIPPANPNTNSPPLLFSSQPLNDTNHTLQLEFPADGSAVEFDFAMITPGAQTDLTNQLVFVGSQDTSVKYNGSWSPDGGTPFLGSVTKGVGHLQFAYQGSSIFVFGVTQGGDNDDTQLSFALDSESGLKTCPSPSGNTGAALICLNRDITPGQHSMILNVQKLKGGSAFSFIGYIFNATESGDSHRASNGVPEVAIIVAVIVGVLVMILVPLVVWTLRRRRRVKAAFILDVTTNASFDHMHHIVDAQDPFADPSENSSANTQDDLQSNPPEYRSTRTQSNSSDVPEYRSSTDLPGYRSTTNTDLPEYCSTTGETLVSNAFPNRTSLRTASDNFSELPEYRRSTTYGCLSTNVP